MIDDSSDDRAMYYIQPVYNGGPINQLQNDLICEFDSFYVFTNKRLSKALATVPLALTPHKVHTGCGLPGLTLQHKDQIDNCEVVDSLVFVVKHGPHFDKFHYN